MFVFYSPNVHVGGGYTLQKDLLPILLERKARVILDDRLRAKLPPHVQNTARLIVPSLWGRLRAEFELLLFANTDSLLCFHSLPPLLPFKGKVYVFFQNMNILDFSGLVGSSIRVRIRLLMERCIFKVFKKKVDRFYVQTRSVKQLLVEKGGVEPDKVVILPFKAPNKEGSVERPGSRSGFVYVADGVAHKNHLNLIRAWSLLAEQGYYPSLKLTLGERDKRLWLKLKKLTDEQKLNVENLGHLSFSEVEATYQLAEALIFPSLKESFGLPLVEVQRFGLPVIASELDYVRDVCCPAETFDPLSPRSIERAVRRFKGWEGDRLDIVTPEDFLDQVLRD